MRDRKFDKREEGVLGRAGVFRDSLLRGALALCLNLLHINEDDYAAEDFSKHVR